MTAHEQRTVNACDEYRAALVTLDAWRERTEAARAQHEQAAASMIEAQRAAERAHARLIAAMKGES